MSTLRQEEQAARMVEARAFDPALNRSEEVEAAVDQAIAACGGDAREAVKALLRANEFLEREMEERVSHGYVRGVRHGRFNTYSG